MKNFAILFFLVIGLSIQMNAQYPSMDEAQPILDSLRQVWGKLEAEAWEKAWPVIVDEMQNKNKVFCPWAERSDDLPQASIPAFPGAEGGGMYSFGGRGGKVCVL